MLVFLFIGVLCFFSCEASTLYKIDNIPTGYKKKLEAGCTRMPTFGVSGKCVGNFDQQCLRLVKIAETVGHQTEDINFAVQTLSDLKREGASGELLTIFVDLFARVVSLIENPVQFSSKVMPFLIQIAENKFLKEGLSRALELSELVCRKGCIKGKAFAVSKILEECCLFSRRAGDPTFFGWSLDVILQVLPYITEQSQVGFVFGFLENILVPIKGSPYSPELLHHIPLAIGTCLTRSGGLMKEAFDQIWGLLHNDPSVLSQMMKTKIGFSQLSDLSGPLIIVLLAKLGEDYFSEALPFFQTAAERICKLDGPDQLFSKFVASVLNSLFFVLQEENNEVDVSCFLVIATAFLNDWIVPDELKNSEIHETLLASLKLVQDGKSDPEQKDDQKIAEFLEKLLDSGRFGIPLEDYLLLANLLDLIEKDKTCYTESIDTLPRYYEFLGFLSFKQKAAFIGSISSQLRFLFQYLTTHTFPRG